MWLDGSDVRDISLEELRASVVLVDQAAFVFNTSILENVRYARPDASEAEVMRAVERAGLAEATSALDAEAQAHVVGAYREIMKGRMTVLITHRKEMLRGVDRVVGVGR